MPNVVREEKLIMVDITTNTNKFWHGRLYDDSSVVTEWGRYAESGGQLKIAGTKSFPSKGSSFLDSKLKEKLDKGYSMQRVVAAVAGAEPTKVVPATSLEQLALKQIKYSNPEVPKFIQFLCQTNVHNITSSTALKYNVSTGLFSTPLGLIAQDGIDEARGYLSTINSVLKSNNSNVSRFEQAVNNYLRIVPQDFGRRRVAPNDIFPDIQTVQKQNDILDGLEASLTKAVVKEEGKEDEKTEEEKLFDTQLELLTDETELERIRALFRATAKDMHYSVKGMKVKRVFVVGINPMTEAYDKYGAKLSNQLELWHGTGTANLLSILKSGFKVTPPSTAAIAGKAFGNGIYFARHSTKSLQYARGTWHGTHNNTCYMFLNDIALGNYYVPRSSTSSNPPSGYDSYWAKPGETGYIQNDEIIVFRADQVKPRYLLELE